MGDENGSRGWGWPTSMLIIKKNRHDKLTSRTHLTLGGLNQKSTPKSWRWGLEVLHSPYRDNSSFFRYRFYLSQRKEQAITRE